LGLNRGFFFAALEGIQGGLFSISYYEIFNFGFILLLSL
jgi:hypothetical protein